MQLKFDEPPPREPTKPRTYKVSELVRLASRKLEAGFGDVWVEGEVSNLRRPSSGHVYFTLKDQRAQLSVVMFRSSVRHLRFDLEDGQKLRCQGRLGVYDAQGRFQLTAEAAEPAGVGGLQLAFEQLKRKLDAEGLFRPDHKKELPLLPRTIAVVTSRTGAALKDIVRVLHNRCPVRVILCPTLVQGSEAPRAIVQALREADEFGADLIIIGRGGGSLEDLWAFNDEAVARAIHAARTPIISAVGHEVDVTISDLVADRRAPTPSGAAEIAVPVQAELRDHLRQQQTRLERAMRQNLRRHLLLLERLHHRIGSPLARVNRGRMALDEVTARLSTALTGAQTRRGTDLGQLKTRLAGQAPRLRLGRDRSTLTALQERAITAVRGRLHSCRTGLAQATSKMEALGPLAVLERGYALVLGEDRSVIRGADHVSPGQPLVLKLARGEIRCVVRDVDLEAE